MDALLVVAAGAATALATGLGALPVILLGERATALRPALLGLSAGVMSVASVVGLLLPGIDAGGAGEVVAGFGIGVAFLLGTRRVVVSRDGFEPAGAAATALLAFIVLTAHSLPEGFAIGTAWASEVDGLALFVVLAIAIQNVPEGTSLAVPLALAGEGAARQFWAAVVSSAPQPAGALVAFLLVEEITALLPFSFGFAAGAMLALVVVELLPPALERGAWPAGLSGAALGAAGMLALSLALGV